VLEWVEVFAIALSISKGSTAQVAELRANCAAAGEALQELTALNECQESGVPSEPDTARATSSVVHAADPGPGSGVFLRQCLNFWRQRDPQYALGGFAGCSAPAALGGRRPSLGERSWSVENPRSAAPGWLDWRRRGGFRSPQEREAGLLRLSWLLPRRRAMTRTLPSGLLREANRAGLPLTPRPGPDPRRLLWDAEPRGCWPGVAVGIGLALRWHSQR